MHPRRLLDRSLILKIALGQIRLTSEFFAVGLLKKKIYDLSGMSILSILLSLNHDVTPSFIHHGQRSLAALLALHSHHQISLPPSSMSGGR
jgi:hypothetical protein